jgi:hypothetical protein
MPPLYPCRRSPDAIGRCSLRAVAHVRVCHCEAKGRGNLVPYCRCEDRDEAISKDCDPVSIISPLMGETGERVKAPVLSLSLAGGASAYRRDLYALHVSRRGIFPRVIARPKAAAISFPSCRCEDRTKQSLKNEFLIFLSLWRKGDLELPGQFKERDFPALSCHCEASETEQFTLTCPEPAKEAVERSLPPVAARPPGRHRSGDSGGEVATALQRKARR